MPDLSYPIGRFRPPADITMSGIETAISHIEQLPEELRRAVADLGPGQLDLPYRPGGWTARQVIHHVADSHMNAYIRFRLTLTEEQPTIKPYDEKRWAELPDARTADPELSLALLDSLHDRWVLLLRSLTPDDFRKPYNHPEYGLRHLDWNALLYGWHGRHHVAHVRLVSSSLHVGA